MSFCDLHMHSTASDGTTPPERLPWEVQAAGVAAFALTDHDTTTGLPACAAAAAKLGLAFAPGIELSVDRSTLKTAAYPVTPGIRLGTLHILGLFIQQDDPQLLRIAAQAVEHREQRNPQIIAQLNRLGVKIDLAEVLAVVAAQHGRIVGRPHIGQVLVQKGYAKSVQDAFARYLGEGQPAYVRKDHLAPSDAIAAIHHAGGLAVLAHPVQMRCTDDAELEHAVKTLTDLGLDGLEVRHHDHLPADVERFTELARRFKLLRSGGSDYHGDRKDIALGSQQAPLAYYESLREAWLERRR